MKVTVLVVEDDVIIGQDIRRILLGFGYDVPAVALTGGDALRAADAHQPDLVLTDIKLRGPLDGIEMAERLRENHDAAIVYLTSHSDEVSLARAKATNPFGYLIKPFTDRELRTCIEVALRRREVEGRATRESERLVVANAILTARCAEHKHESERMMAVARTDPLTEASNRLHLREDLEGIADRAKRYGHRYCAAFCDVDGFKSYNDTFGHLAGDEAIRMVAGTIRRGLRRGDGFYRYGGDEFLVLLPEQSLVHATECMERVRAAVEATGVGAGPLARALTISIGIAELRVTADEDSMQSCLEEADRALYRAKGRGRNCVEAAQ